MILVPRPGNEPLEIEYILLDFEGTLATDGRVHPKAKDKINLLSKRSRIYILVKERKEKAEEVLRKVKGDFVFLKEGEASEAKVTLLHRLGGTHVAAIGNGMDDISMISAAGLGMAVMTREGSSAELIQKADLVFMNIIDALDFLLKPLRQKATLGK